MHTFYSIKGSINAWAQNLRQNFQSIYYINIDKLSFKDISPWQLIKYKENRKIKAQSRRMVYKPVIAIESYNESWR